MFEDEFRLLGNLFDDVTGGTSRRKIIKQQQQIISLLSSRQPEPMPDSKCPHCDQTYKLGDYSEHRKNDCTGRKFDE